MLNRPLPVPDVESAPFWEACRDGRLLIQKIGNSYQFPPMHYGASNPAQKPEWVQASGRGTVYSWIVVHIGIPKDIYGDQVPYVTAFITLEEGPRICANLVGIASAEIVAGMPVEVFFEPVGDGSITLPFFRARK